MCGIKIKRRFKVDGRIFRIVKQYSYHMSYEAFYTGYISPADLLGKVIKLPNEYGFLNNYRVVEIANKTMPVFNDKYVKRTYITIVNEDKRQLFFYWQRDYRGFDNSDMWNLESKILDWLIPRLKVFSYFAKGSGWFDGKGGYVKGDKIVEEILKGFKIYHEKDFFSKKESNIINHSFNLFKKHFGDLWT